eukprot:scaffold158884_cov14-Tisochrysis_lutea.AAC.2
MSSGAPWSNSRDRNERGSGQGSKETSADMPSCGTPFRSGAQGMQHAAAGAQGNSGKRHGSLAPRGTNMHGI